MQENTENNGRIRNNKTDAGGEQETDNLFEVALFTFSVPRLT